MLFSAGTLLKKNGQHATETNLDNKCDLVRDEISDACLGHDGNHDDSMDSKVTDFQYHEYASAGSLMW